ncbi:acyltransferase [Halobacterium salinarum]|uniref:acyltransferase n=1 Tax=Halobacterium salinarum TaxID=2242 RepID=UPI001F452FAF|nr:acyltransferase [Halobacterium salinarum]MCF2165807.1 acyltransferase [Halobacterium salinarum]MCF2167424.1 acyltransferase [Halobacterium salinarum]
MTKRHVSLPADAKDVRRAFVSGVDERLSAAETPDELATAVTETLADLRGERDAYEAWRDGDDTRPAAAARLATLDPRNASLESEYYAEKDEAAFARSKPLQWLWRQFDTTPLADNVDVALPFRRMLAGHLFAGVGEDVRLFKGITMTYGHNIELGDNVVVHDGVHLDDRGELVVGARASVSDGAHLYTHDHDVVDQTDVTNYRTEIGADARVTQGALVRAGVRVGENALVGSRSVVQGDVPAHHIAVGSPAESVRVKPGWEPVAAPLDAGGERRQAERRLDDAVPADAAVYDEFQRDRSPPGER